MGLVFSMIWKNLFRTPKVKATKGAQVGDEAFFSDWGSADGSSGMEGGDDKIMIEESWPHLQVVYELLLRIII